MKKILVLLCLLFLTTPAPSLASDWSVIGTAKSGNQYYIDLDEMYFDRSAGRIDKNMIIAHEKALLSSAEIARYQNITRKRGQYHSGWDYLTYTLTYYQYDISSKTYAIKYLAFMNQNDNLIAEFHQKPLKFKVIPNGFDTKEYNLVLKNLDRVKD